MSAVLQQFDYPHVYFAAFTSFYGFLRISNLVAPTQHSFDHARQLTRADISFTQSRVRLFLKWAKNLQKAQQSNMVMLPRMMNPLLCPVQILSTLFSSQVFAPSDPVIKVLTEAQFRKRLHLVLTVLNLPTASLTYHSLRRSGASLAFNHKVDFGAIKTHGAWGSDAIYKYLLSNSDSIQQVPRMFQELETSL